MSILFVDLSSMLFTLRIPMRGYEYMAQSVHEIYIMLRIPMRGYEGLKLAQEWF